MKASVHFCHFLFKKNYKGTRKLQKHPEATHSLCLLGNTITSIQLLRTPLSGQDLKGHLLELPHVTDDTTHAQKE